MMDGLLTPKLNEPFTDRAPHTNLEQRLDKLFTRFWAQLEARAESTQAQGRRRPRGGEESVMQP
ncbi:Hypothetical predicted protein [Pelobates cultripes]|uniref:Uncharacterized protein n=1 Tax=Pelobates cultripes TaxID=61616 RepID=A0AAD1S401_PELCU|nr:Hypothetical predicted protein [Pelobates cultripes]